ncbi:SpaA isopeptide-forming pilin-related protein [Enterococcus casseliflavus]|nr:SpaA isopeptide-forming pilin-related protein [Enterococcus casseliflavus]
MSNFRKFLTTFMLFLTLSGTIIEPVSIWAETVNTVETQEVEKDTLGAETVDSSAKEKEISIVSSDQSTNTKYDQAEKVGESQNANDSPNLSIENTTDQDENQSVHDYLREQGYKMMDNGSIASTTGSAYRENYLSVIQEVQNMLDPNHPITFASGQSVYVDKNYGSSAIGWTNSNGISELGWYAKKDVNGGMLWCIEPGIPLNWGQNSPYTTSEINEDKYIRASLAVYYGWEKQKSVVNAFYTERLVQEITTGVTPSGIYDYNGVASQSGYNNFRKKVLAEVETFYNLPSFAGKTYSVKLGETLTLKDSNGTLPKYKVTSNTANVTISQAGDTLKITPTATSNESGKIVLKYQIDTSFLGASILYTAPYLQDVMKARVKDPVSFQINLNVELQGQGEIIKVDDDGNALPGAQFEITNKTTGKTETKTTDKNGKISGKWDVGTVLEIKEVKAPNGYVLSTEKKTLTIEANKTKSVTFTNKRQLGTISIDKSGSEFGKDMPNGNYTLKGNTFEVYAGSKATGTPVTTITTDEKGQAKTKALPLGTYTLKETAASEGYILNENTWTVELTYAGQNVEITNVDQRIENKEQLADLTVIKEDKETGSQPQGAATLIGAEYTLTDSSGQVVGTMVMQEKNGVIQSELKGLKLGTYTLKETKAPEGYNLDPTEYEVKLTYAGQNETVALHSKTVTDQVIKGNIEGYKFGSRPLIPNTLEDLVDRLSGTNQDIKPPLEGVELTVTSHTTGQKYVEVTGKNGYFKFENLPYDTYTIEETKGIDGYLLIEPFEVTISEEGYTHFFLLEDRIIESKIHIVKVDEETGENIPYAGAQFKIFDTWANDGEGAFVSMQRPNDMESTEVFETNEKGEIVTTESLAWGIDRYELHEVKAPEGYVAMEEPIVFSVTEEDADALIRLEVPNRLARQDVQLIKKDRLNEQPLANVPFKLYQIENDGAETLVDEFVTDEKGMISIEGLPYGKYKFVEGQPLPGYLELEEGIEFSVTVENDGELIVLEAVNEREDLEITTLFASVDGQKEIDPTVDNQLKDTVWVKGDAIEIGHTYTVVTKYKNTETGAVVSEDTSRYTAKSKDDTFEVYLDLKANTLKDGDRLTATHTIYYEEEQENEVGKEDDLSNKEQTVTFRTPKRTLPKTGATTSIYLTVAGLFLFVLGAALLFKRKNSQ